MSEMSELSDLSDPLARLRAITALAPFNRWLGLQVESAGPGTVELRVPWRAELGQYSGFMHAAIIAGLIDTACGFACATTMTGPLVASTFSVRCLRPAVADVFVARGRAVKVGRRQCFATAELFALAAPDIWFATGDGVLVPTA